jgi:two-component system sensor histidine kinase KdpD
MKDRRQAPALRRFLSIDYRIRWVNFLWTLSSVAATTAALLLLRSRLSNQVIALLYLLPVMLSATRWGLLPALTASLLSFFAFNFFFLFPTFTFAVGNTDELLALMIFLIVAVIISQAVATANMHAVQAEAREREATTLYALSRTLEEQTGLEETLASVARMIAEAFSFAGCEILVGAEESDPAIRLSQAAEAEGGTPPGSPGSSPQGGFPIKRGEARPESGDTCPLRTMDIPLAARQAVAGVLRLHLREGASPPDAATVRLLTTFAAQAGLFIERSKLAQEAGRAQLLEESDRLKSALLSSVSHDLRTPLAAIKASATVLLQEDAALDPTTRSDLLAGINEETDRLNHLVGDLLDQSRIEAGALRLKLDWCDLDELIRAVVRRFGAALDVFRVQLDLPADLPLAFADYVQVDRVISNLLDNAVRFAPPGSAIDIAARAEGNRLTVAVTNQGPAIPARLHPHLFDKFYRISEDRSPSMGTGLGLSICKGIVEAHGGRIRVESPVTGESGTRFAFTLPVREPDGRSEKADDEEDQNTHRG